MSEEKIKQILSALSRGVENVSFLHDAYMQLEAYGNNGPLSAEVAQALKRIRIYSARQAEMHRYVMLTPDNAVDFDVYLSILEKSPQQSPAQQAEIRKTRLSLIPYLEKFDEENGISSVNENTDVNANADLWNKATSLIAPAQLYSSSGGTEQYRITKGFEKLIPFFVSLDKKTYSEVIDLARIETIQSLSANPPSSDRKAVRQAYISKMNDVLGQISAELLHEYKHREFQVFSSTDKSFYAQDSYLEQSIKKQFGVDTFSNKGRLRASMAAVNCTRSAHIARVATRLQIKSRAKEVWQKVYEWDAKMGKKHPFLYPAAKSATISLTTGMIGSLAYSGYKLERSIRRSVENYHQNADKQKYKDYFSYITAQENFNELVDLGKSTALIAVSGIFAGSVITEHGINAAGGLVGHISEHGVGSLFSAQSATHGLIDKLKHINISSFVKSLASNSRIWASTAVSVSAGIATGVNTSLQQRQAELELDELLKLRGATKFPHNPKTLKLRSTDPETYYTLVIKHNEITLSAKDKQLLAEKAMLINSKRQEKKRRGWGSGIGTALGLAGAGILGSGNSKIELHDNIDIDLTVENNTDISEHITATQVEPHTTEPAHVHAAASNLAAFTSHKSGSLADNDEITVGEKLRIIKGERPNIVQSEHVEAPVSKPAVPAPGQTTHKLAADVASNHNYGTDTDENKLVSEKIREHMAASPSKNLLAHATPSQAPESDSDSELITSTADLSGFTQSQTGLSYKIDDDGSIIFKGGIPDDQTAAQIEAEAFANIRKAEADGAEISAGDRLFMNEYAYNNDINVQQSPANVPAPEQEEYIAVAPAVIEEISDYDIAQDETANYEQDTYIAESTPSTDTYILETPTPHHGRTRTVIEDDIYCSPSKKIAVEHTCSHARSSDSKYFYSVSKGFFSLNDRG